MELISLKGYRKILGLSHIRVRGKPRVDEVLEEIKGSPEGLTVQLLDSRAIAGRNHVYHAVRLCLKAFRRKLPISRNLQVELLLYLAARRQIDDSIRILGVKEDTRNIVAIVLGNSKESITRYMGGLVSRLGEAIPTQLIGGKGVMDPKYIAQIYQIEREELDATYLNGSQFMNILEKLVLERIALFSL
jgi:tRNA threonylcarbamoyladenosine modification (KEOPS) complex Cgi121 subunit